MLSKFIVYFIVLFVGISLPNYLFPQQDSLLLMKSRTEFSSSRDSANASIQDSIKRFAQKIQDSIKALKPKSGIDTVVTYNGKDSVVFSINSKKMELHGNAQIVLKQQKLEAEYIELDFQKNTMFAHGLEDSIKGLVGFPKFTESGEQYAGEKILYNFKTNKGVINLGETDLGEGFYFGSKIKRISQNEMFVQNGYYTTCDAPHPHYYFGSPEMKVVVKDRILLDPITFYVEDMPLFTIPFGLFFPNKGGRQSGILIPSFFFSENRGVVLENFGIYLALSDYYDTKITGNFYSKGGYIAKTFTQWHLLNQFSGNLRFEFGKTRMNVDEPYKDQYSVGLNHSHQFNPNSKMDVRLDFRSQDYNRSTSTSINDQIQQNITSNASYQLNFDNGSSFSIGYQRDQNIITNEFTQTFPTVSYSLPNLYPLKPLVSDDNWLGNISLSYAVRAKRDDFHKLQSTMLPDSTRDTSFVDTYSQYISHLPGISISPKLGYFTVQPSFSFGANNYFRRITKTSNPNDSSVTTTSENGFYTEYTYSTGIGLQTTLYGIADDRSPFLGFIKPTWLGFKALRHTYQPRVSYNLTPDLSDPGLGFYGTYYDYNTNREVKYSRYELDGGTHASSQKYSSISYSDLHKFEIKVAQQDTLPDKNLELLTFNFNGSYNLAADSLGLSDIGMSFRSPALSFLSFNGRAGFTLYDEVAVYNDASRSYNYIKIDELRIKNGKGLARMNTLSLDLSTQFGSDGIGISSSSDQTARTPKDSTKSALGERFLRRITHTETEADLFGDCTPGYSSFAFPWRMNIGVNYNFSEYTPNQVSERFNVSATLNFTLATSWVFTVTGQYDIIANELLTPQFSIIKDLHCWELIFNWYPSGYNQGFYLKFGIKSDQLKDLMLEQRSNQLYR